MHILTVDCEWNIWGDWTSCSKECGGGKNSRIRTEMSAAANDGVQCVGDPTEEQACNTDVCPGL